MRRKEKKIEDAALIGAILDTCPVGRLGTIGRDGYPMVKPVNFTHRDGKIYVHSAKEGEKIEDIRRDSRVCFEVDIPIAYVEPGRNPCEADYLFRSVIAKGRARLVEDEAEKVLALRLLMDKYQGEGKYGDFTREKLGVVGVIRIEVEEATGKEHLGRGGPREAALQAITERQRLPLRLKPGE